MVKVVHIFPNFINISTVFPHFPHSITKKVNSILAQVS